MGNRRLHGSPGDSDNVGQSGVADCDRFFSHPVSKPVELKIHEKSRGRAAVRDQITHQSVDDVGIYFHGYGKHNYSMLFRVSRLSG